MDALKGFTPAQAASMFCQAAVQSGLLNQDDLSFALNQVLDLMRLPAPGQAASMLPLLDIRDMLLDHAVAEGLCEDSTEARERFSARLFGLVTPSPHMINQCFQAHYQKGPEQATDWFYQLCRQNDYIRTREIARNILYEAPSPAGKLEITINLSKPEKDPRDIAAARRAVSSDYPTCMLCPENPGYGGRPGYPARQNHRIIPLRLAGKRWYFQYSPYLYYPEHCIAFNEKHLPMGMDGSSFERMFDFVDAFPHYFIGSNADLPIVGGSILSHDHFQGGRHVFPMERARPWFDIRWEDEGVQAEALQWPMSCIRLSSPHRDTLKAAMLRVLEAWKDYSDESLDILARSSERHNAITPVLRLIGGRYQAYLLLRNNRVSDQHPLGIFHPHAQWHHIKKENIGLIEAMGTFILPGRLKDELIQLEQALLAGSPLPAGSPHAAWLQDIRRHYPKGADEAATRQFVRQQVGAVCYQVLCDTGVFKQDARGRAGFERFISHMGMMS